MAEQKQGVLSGLTTGLFAELLLVRRVMALLLMVILTGPADAQNLLEPMDTSSPRATMQSFLMQIDDAGRRVAEYREDPSPATQQALSQSLVKSWRLLDLSQVPSAYRVVVADDTFVLLWDVMARLELPDLEEIPGVSAVMEGDGRPTTPMVWRVPGTEITIARVVEGDRAGEYLFSPDTVKRLPVFYEVAQDLPYKRQMPSDNLLWTDQLLTGWMIPMAWVEAFPDWINTPVLGQVLWKWFVVVLLLGLTLVAAIVGFRWSRQRKLDDSPGSYLRRLSVPLGILVLAMLLRYLFHYQINLTGAATGIPDFLIEVVSGVAMVWLVWLTSCWIAEVIIIRAQTSQKSLDASLLRLAARTIGILAALVLVFDMLHGIGIPVYGLIAGAGVGGLAVALAIRPTLENLVGGVILFLDKPVRVGDFCSFGDHTGTVESIGIRSTKFRAIDRTLISIPNAAFVDMELVNWAKCDQMLITTTIGLRYETDSDQLRYVLVKLREMLHAHPKIDPETVRVRFAGYGASSLDIGVRVYALTQEWNEFHAIREDVFLRVKDIVEESGTGFAFPSQTLYMGRDDGLDDQRGEAVIEEVRSWRRQGKLPFPGLGADRVNQLEGTLEYPPRGSVEVGLSEEEISEGAERLSTEPRSEVSEKP